MSKLTVVVPCYDEARRLKLEDFAEHELVSAGGDLLFVDDGSRDDTLSILNQAAERWPARVRVLALPENRGKGEAVRAGLLAAMGAGATELAYLDADLSTPLEALTDLLAVLRADEGVEIVLASRIRLLGRAIERRPFRHYVGRVFATCASLALGLPVYDTQCGAKVLRGGPRLASLLKEPFGSRWCFDVELLARHVQAARLAGEEPERALVEVPLMRWRDVAGSHMKLRDGLRAFLDVLAIRRRYLSRGARGGSETTPGE
jgi:glycosyltransferase involved in cell wall biosynthesis